MTDAQLLDQFVSSRSEAAFGELVARHSAWVEASARRRLHDPGLAEDATQAVFILLAQKAASLRKEVVLSAWLFSALRFTCLAISRSERRRKIREDEAAAMRNTDSDTNQVWGELSGQLDEVVAKLSGSDRRAVLLRFYESKTYGEVGAVLGISEEAARKRVERAVDKLQGMFHRRGISLSSGAIGAAMLIHVAPSGGACGVATTSVVSAALSAASGTSAAAAKTAGGMIAFAQAKAAAIVIAASVAIVAAGGAGVVISKSKRAKPQAASAPAIVFAAAPAVGATQPIAATKTFVAGVVFTPDDQTIANARITLVGRKMIMDTISLGSTTSDANGTFRLNAPDNASSAIVDAPPWAYGYAFPSSDPEQAVNLMESHTAELQFRLPDGSPAAGVEVSPAECVGSSGTPTDFWGIEFPRELRKTLARKTDAQGKVRFERMPAGGHLRVEVRDDRFATLTFSQGVSVGTDAVSVGEPIILQPVAEMRGHISGLDGAPAANIMVMALGRNSSGNWGAAITDARGDYRITRLGGGGYDVVLARGEDDVIDSTSPWTAKALQNVAVGVGASVTGIDLALETGTLITGKVTLKDTKAPVGDFEMCAYGPSRPESCGSVDHVKTNADGTYAIRVPAGTNYIYPAGDPPGGYDLGSNGARLVKTAAGKDGVANFSLPRLAGKPLSGTVTRTDGSPAAGAWVTARLGDQSPGNGPGTKADAQGRFKFDSLPVKAELRATAGRLRTAAPVDAKPGDANVSLRVVKVTPVTVKGRVLDANGKPIRGAKVYLTVHYGGYGEASAPVTSDADGNYIIRDVMPGEKYTITASASRFGQTNAAVSLKAGEASVPQPALTLEQADSLVTGRVLDSAGEPVADVEVSISGRATAWQSMKTDTDGRFEFVDVVEGETLNVNLHRGNDYVNGDELKAGTIGAEVLFKAEKKK